MRVVIDTNRLSSTELMAFFMLSTRNRAVLTDFVAMEAYQPVADHHVLKNMVVLSSFPNQVDVLRGTVVVGTLDPVLDIMPDAMIDREQTNGFPAFAQAMAAAHEGDGDILSQIDERRGWAKDQLGFMLRETPDTSDVFIRIRALFTDAQWATYARNEPLSQETVHRILRIATDEAECMAALHPSRPRLPNQPAQMLNHFTWRLMLCRVLRIMRQVAGGVQTQKPNQFRNDMIDAFIAAYATYFGGLMTNDANAMETHAVARTILSNLGVRLARDYLNGTQKRVADLIDEQRRIAGMAPIRRVGIQSPTSPSEPQERV